MFRNNYHPAFVMGGFCFAVGVSFIAFSCIVYAEIFGINAYEGQSGVSFYNREEFWIWLGFLAPGLTFLGSGLGIMRGNKVARNIAVLSSFFCLAGLVLFCGIVATNLGSDRNGRTIQILLLFAFTVFLSSIILSTIFILTGNNTREYFGEDKIDTHEDLLDNI